MNIPNSKYSIFFDASLVLVNVFFVSHPRVGILMVHFGFVVNTYYARFEFNIINSNTKSLFMIFVHKLF